MAAPTAPAGKVCKRCGVLLVPYQNWTVGQIKHYAYVCRKCKTDLSTERRRKLGIKERQRSQRYSAEWRKNRKIEHIQYWKANPERRCWHQYKANAKKRGYIFNISFKEFLSFKGMSCFYCGGQVETAAEIGLDRIDNAKGYTIDNVISCCSMCNWMKLDLTQEAFISHCKKIYLEQQKWQHQQPQRPALFALRV